MTKFDPYHRWLGIPPHEQPATLYRLLGISDFETDREVITEASYRQIGHVKQYASGPHRDAANEILNELAKAQVVLLNPRKKTQYDISIQEVDEEEVDEAVKEEDESASPVVQVTSAVASGSFKTTGASPRSKRRRKQSNLLQIFSALAVLAFVLFTFGYWWMQQSAKEPSTETVAVNSETTAPTDSEESKSGLADADKPKEATDPVEPSPEKTEAGNTKPANIEPAKAA